MSLNIIADRRKSITLSGLALGGGDNSPNSSHSSDKAAPTTPSVSDTSGKNPQFARTTLRKNSILKQSLNTFRYKAAIEAVKTANEEEFDSIEDIRLGLKKYLTNSLVGSLYENFTIFISVISAIEYIHSTYANDHHNRYWKQTYPLDKAELCFAGVFLFDWALKYFLADSKFNFFWT
jgi:hypothetical protein